MLQLVGSYSRHERCKKRVGDDSQFLEIFTEPAEFLALIPGAGKLSSAR